MKTSTLLGVAAIGAVTYFLMKRADGESTPIPETVPIESASITPQQVVAQPYYVQVMSPSTKDVSTRKISTIQEGVDFINEFTSSGNVPVTPFARGTPTSVNVGGVKVPGRIETFQEPGGAVRKSVVTVDVGRVTKTPQKAIDWMRSNNRKKDVLAKFK